MELEKTGARRRALANRRVMLLDDTATGDVLLDEALRHIKETQPQETVQSWIEYLSGTYRNLLQQSASHRWLSVESTRLLLLLTRCRVSSFSDMSLFSMNAAENLLSTICIGISRTLSTIVEHASSKLYQRNCLKRHRNKFEDSPQFTVHVWLV